MKTQTPDLMKPTDYKELTRDLLIKEGKYSESSVDRFIEFCEKQYDKLYKPEFKDDVNGFYRRVCGLVITFGFNQESVRFTLTQNISDMSVGIKQAKLHEEKESEVYYWGKDVEFCVSGALKKNPLTMDLDETVWNDIIDDFSAMSVYLIPDNRFAKLIDEYQDRLNIAELYYALSCNPDNKINSIKIISECIPKNTQLSSEFAKNELPPLILDKFGISDHETINDSAEFIKRRGEVVQKCKEELDYILTLEDNYKFFVVRLIYCILIEHEIVIGKKSNDNFLGLADKKGHAITIGKNDSELVYDILNRLKIITTTSKKKKKEKANQSEDKDRIISILKLGHEEERDGNRQVILEKKKKEMLDMIKKGAFFENLERCFYKYGLIDLNQSRREEVKDYCIARLMDTSTLKK